MKHFLRVFGCAICAFSLFACAKEIETPVNPAEEPSTSELVQITLTALSEQTKTTIDAGVTKWAAEDKIKVICDDGPVSEPFEIVDGIGETSGSFSGFIPAGKTALHTVYPAASFSAVSGTSVKVVIPAAQNGVFGAGNVAVANVAADHSMAFKNVNAFISFSVPAGVTKVVISSVDESPLAGTLSVDCSGTYPAATTTYESTASAITAEIDGVGGTYYVSALPGQAHAKGLLFEYYKTEGAAYKWTGSYYLNKNISTVANGNMQMGEVETNGNYYVTVSGAGNQNGMSWANAMSAAKMWKKITFAGTDPATDAAKFEAVNGAVFHLGAGTYYFGADPTITSSSEVLKLTFKGDYPAAGGERDRTGAVNRAVFTGTDPENSSNKGPAIKLRGKVNINFSGIRFTGGYGVNDEDNSGVSAALDCYGDDESDISVAMTYCDVKDNTHADNGNYGAGVRLCGVKSFSADSVTFARNSSPGAAALSIRNTQARLENCKFFDNSASADGGAVYHAGNLAASFHTCTFSDNVADKLGGAICYNSSKNINLYGCTFNHCHAKNGGAIATRTGSLARLRISGGSFIDCYANGGGAVYVQSKWYKDGSLSIDKYNEVGTLFQECHAINGTYGGAIGIKSNAYVLIQGASFVGNYAAYGGAVDVNFIKASDGYPDVFISESSFDGNYVTNKWGTDILVNHADNVIVYNSSFRNGHTRNSDTSLQNSAKPAWILINDGAMKSGGKVVLANCSLIGNPQYSSDGVTFTPCTNATSLFYTCSPETNAIINSIIVPEDASIAAIRGEYSNEPIELFYTHYSSVADTATPTNSGGSVSGLSKSSIGSVSWTDGCWTWNGKIGGSTPSMATRNDVFSKVDGFNHDFTEWVYFNYDQRHESRGTGSWWPGAYQSN